ncbi:MAG: metallophosphoesterase [Clostridiales bacterium]|nr:metallophosphoesterase [Clostridiales bacterium]
MTTNLVNHASKKRDRKKLLCTVAIILIAIVVFVAFDVRLSVSTYMVDARQITGNIGIAYVSDLHSCNYGTGQKTLIDAVHDLNPDLVMLGGDIFDDVLPDENTEQFLAGIAESYPCYYVTGNHEYWSGSERFSEQMSILQKYGITVLSGECNTVSVNGEHINICGIDDPDAFDVSDRHVRVIEQLECVNTDSENNFYTVLLAHRPEFFDLYSEYGFDLVLCGHAHGGQWRIPEILNGLYAPGQGWFPEYAGGMYTQSSTTMIVSRGLARESTRIPRIFNRPELLLIEIK